VCRLPQPRRRIGLDERARIGFIPAMNTNDIDRLKHEAAARAVEYVTSGMRVGLGSGSTSEAFINLLGARVRGGLDIVGVPTSERTAQLARSLGIALGNLNDLAPLDLDVDGADEADYALDLIKGGGGALLREKIVAASSKKMIVMIHGPKLVEKMGAFPLPVEMVEFGHAETAKRIAAAVKALGYGDVPMTLRKKNDAIAKTDSGNMIYDLAFGPTITQAASLATALSCVPGVVEHGLYIGIATTLIVARPEGIEIIERS
jgi:ribose 5-phosphate isomerase A